MPVQCEQCECVWTTEESLSRENQYRQRYKYGTEKPHGQESNPQPSHCVATEQTSHELLITVLFPNVMFGTAVMRMLQSASLTVTKTKPVESCCLSCSSDVVQPTTFICLDKQWSRRSHPGCVSGMPPQPPDAFGPQQGAKRKPKGDSGGLHHPIKKNKNKTRINLVKSLSYLIFLQTEHRHLL